MANLPKNVCRERTRHGRIVYYFRAGGTRVRLPDADAPGFAAAVEDVRKNIVLPARPKHVPQSFNRRNRRTAGLAVERAVRAAKKRAVDKRLAFDLDVEWALDALKAQDFKCVLTSIPFYMESSASSKVHPYMPSLDRIEPKKGYVRGNVRIVVYAINVMLMDWGVDVFERVVSGRRYTKGTKTRTLFPHLRQEVRAGKEIVQ